MKDEIQKLACDIIDKTGLEISESNRLDIIEKAVKTAMDHIATRLVEIPLPGLLRLPAHHSCLQRKPSSSNFIPVVRNRYQSRQMQGVKNDG